MSKIGKKPLVNINYPKDSLRYFNFAMLFFLILAALATMSPVYCSWFCPFKIITEYEQISHFRSLIAAVLFILVFFGLVIVLPYLTKKRFQCITFCPFGAMQSLIGKISIYRIRIDTLRCTGCMRCVEACPNLALKKESIGEKTGQPLKICTRCGCCISICPEKAINYHFAAGNDIIEKIFLKLLDELANKEKFPVRISNFIVRTLRDLLTPYALFTFTAMTFGVTISSLFSSDLIHRVLNLLINGSFLLGR